MKNMFHPSMTWAYGAYSVHPLQYIIKNDCKCSMTGTGAATTFHEGVPSNVGSQFVCIPLSATPYPV